MAKSEERGGILVNHRQTITTLRVANRTLFIPAAIYEGVTMKEAGQLPIPAELVTHIRSKPQAIAHLQSLVDRKEMNVIGFELTLLPGASTRGAEQAAA